MTPGAIPNRELPDPSVVSLLMTPSEFDELKNRVKVLEIRLEENTQLTHKSIELSEEIKTSTASIVEFTTNAAGALKTLNWLINIFKPLAYVGAFILACWAMFNVIKVYIIQAIQNGSIK